jgi:hypothetical protein
MEYRPLAKCEFCMDTMACSDFELEDDGVKEDLNTYVSCLSAFASACRRKLMLERRALLADLVKRHCVTLPSVIPEVSRVRRGFVKVGRNDPCPCESGKKYKKCCG